MSIPVFGQILPTKPATSATPKGNALISRRAGEFIMSTTDKQIADILAKYDEPMAGNVWRVQGRAVIYHKALERIATKAKICWSEPTIVRAERDEAVLLVTGIMDKRVEWSIGEALIGVNYRVSGKQAAYVWAMAEKRAKDRVILKLIELAGVLYSEEEADEFKAARPGAPQADEDDRQGEQVPGLSKDVQTIIDGFRCATQEETVTLLANDKGTKRIYAAASDTEKAAISAAIREARVRLLGETERQSYEEARGQ